MTHRNEWNLYGVWVDSIRIILGFLDFDDLLCIFHKSLYISMLAA